VISSFDLTLMGSLVSAGGVLFLRQGQWPRLGWSPLNNLTQESRARWERSTALAGVRWLTVGTLTLFVAYTHGAETGSLFSPWLDIVFHTLFVSAAWCMTAYRITQNAEQPSSVGPLSAGSLREQ